MTTEYGGVIGTRTAFTITLNSLANNTYVAGTAVDFHAVTTPGGATLLPIDIIVEAELTPGTVASAFQAKILMQASMDGSNYSTGPTSGTTITDEPDLYLLGYLPLNSNSTLQRKGFSVAREIGFIPYSLKPVVMNVSGAALAGSGNALYYTVIFGKSA